MRLILLSVLSTILVLACKATCRATQAAIEIALGGTARIIGAMRELQQRVSTNSSVPPSARSNSAVVEQTSSKPPANYFTNPIVNVHPDLYLAVRQLAFNKVADVLRTVSHDKISRDEAIADVRAFVLSHIKGIHYRFTALLFITTIYCNMIRDDHLKVMILVRFNTVHVVSMWLQK